MILGSNGTVVGSTTSIIDNRATYTAAITPNTNVLKIYIAANEACDVIIRYNDGYASTISIAQNAVAAATRTNATAGNSYTVYITSNNPVKGIYFYNAKVALGQSYYKNNYSYYKKDSNVTISQNIFSGNNQIEYLDINSYELPILASDICISEYAGIINISNSPNFTGELNFSENVYPNLASFNLLNVRGQALSSDINKLLNPTCFPSLNILNFSSVNSSSTSYSIPVSFPETSPIRQFSIIDTIAYTGDATNLLLSIIKNPTNDIKNFSTISPWAKAPSNIYVRSEMLNQDYYAYRYMSTISYNPSGDISMISNKINAKRVLIQPTADSYGIMNNLKNIRGCIYLDIYLGIAGNVNFDLDDISRVGEDSAYMSFDITDYRNSGPARIIGNAAHFGDRTNVTSIDLSLFIYFQSQTLEGTSGWNEMIDNMYANREISAYVKIILSSKISAALTGTYQAPTGFVQDEEDGSPTSSMEKIYVLVNNYGILFSGL